MVWQTAVHPVVALELLAEGVWQGVGVNGPEAFRADPFLDLLADEAHPAVYDVCRRHADSLSAPRGWTLLDRRRGPASLAGPLTEL